MRIVSWNIHGCVGTDRRFRPQRTLDVLRQFDADVMALQEVHAGRPPDPRFDGFDYFRRQLGPHAAVAQTTADGDGRYGHMLVSRWPIAHQTAHDISVPGREPRSLLEVVLRTPAGGLNVFAMHLGLKAAERRRQAAMLARCLLHARPLPTVVLGDLNLLRRHSPVERVMGEVFARQPAPATFPSQLPLLALDRIWCRPAGLIEMLTVWTGDRRASDHLPLLADLARQAVPEPPSIRQASSP